MTLLKKVSDCPGQLEISAHCVLEVRQLQGLSQLTRAYAEPPLGIRSPKPIAGVAQVYLTALGGGVLPQDRFEIEVKAHPHARLFLGSQSATRIFKTPEGLCRQNLRGEVGADALVVHMPDPVLPYAQARFEQSQQWTLQNGSRLALGEVLQAGRLSRGEVFAFSRFQSNWRIENGYGRPLLLDRISLDPCRQDVSAPGGFALPDTSDGVSGDGGLFTQWASYAFCGRGWQGLEAHLRHALRALPLWPWGVAGPNEVSRPLDRKVLAALWRKDEEVLLLRAMAVDRQALTTVLEPLQQAMAREDALGFSPWARKF